LPCARGQPRGRFCTLGAPGRCGRRARGEW
jgi:hypothetical protein